MTDPKEVIKWFGGKDTGLSSEAIAMHMVTGDCNGSYPHDPADLGRCLRLLRLFPEWKERIPEMAKYGPVWVEYAKNWADMEKCMTDEVGIDWEKGKRASKTYDLMKSLDAIAWSKK